MDAGFYQVINGGVRVEVSVEVEHRCDIINFFCVLCVGLFRYAESGLCVFWCSVAPHGVICLD